MIKTIFNVNWFLFYFLIKIVPLELFYRKIDLSNRRSLRKAGAKQLVIAQRCHISKIFLKPVRLDMFERSATVNGKRINWNDFSAIALNDGTTI